MTPIIVVARNIRFLRRIYYYYYELYLQNMLISLFKLGKLIASYYYPKTKSKRFLKWHTLFQFFI